MTSKEAIELLLNYYKDCKVLSVRESPNAFIIAIKPKNFKGDIVDNSFLINKKTSKIDTFVMALHADEYRKSRKIS